MPITMIEGTSELRYMCKALGLRQVRLDWLPLTCDNVWKFASEYTDRC